jgi:hypothetical protein
VSISYFPEGTVVSINTLTLHRDPRNFSPFTEEFWPERWLIVQSLMDLPSSVPEAEFVHNAAAFIPFSYGGSIRFKIGGGLLTHTYPVQVQPIASGSLWQFSVNDLTNDHVRFMLSKSYDRTSDGDCMHSPGPRHPF